MANLKMIQSSHAAVNRVKKSMVNSQLKWAVTEKANKMYRDRKKTKAK